MSHGSLCDMFPLCFMSLVLHPHIIIFDHVNLFSLFTSSFCMTNTSAAWNISMLLFRLNNSNLRFSHTPCTLAHWVGFPDSCWRIAVLMWPNAWCVRWYGYRIDVKENSLVFALDRFSRVSIVLVWTIDSMKIYMRNGWLDVILTFCHIQITNQF